jgi:hypothetical protein
MEVLLVLAVVAVAVAVIAKEGKYREIREAELDYRTGKLSSDDWHALDATLRREAIELLRRLDALGESEEEGVR